MSHYTKFANTFIDILVSGNRMSKDYGMRYRDLGPGLVGWKDRANIYERVNNAYHEIALLASEVLEESE